MDCACKGGEALVDMSSDAAYAALGLALEPTPVPLIRVDTEVTAAQMYGDAPANAD